jgi:hypothetical protein
VGGDVSVDSEVFLVTDFINLKIKSSQSFRCVHKNMVCVRVFIEINVHTCMSIYICTVFLKKIGASYARLENHPMLRGYRKMQILSPTYFFSKITSKHLGLGGQLPHPQHDPKPKRLLSC